MSEKKLMFLMLMAIVVMFAFSCDSNSTDGGDTPPTILPVIPTIGPPASKYYVYGDGDGVSVDFDGKYYEGFDNTATSTEPTTGGAGNNGKYRSITGSGGEWAGGGWQYDLGTNIVVDLTSYTTLKFSVKSEVVTTMDARLGSDDEIARNIGVSGITNAWTEKSVPLSRFTSGLDPVNLSRVQVLFAFILSNSNDRIDIDEVYFTDEPIIDPPPGDGKYYVYGDGDGVSVDFDGAHYGGYESTATSAVRTTGGAGNDGEYQSITGLASVLDWAAGGWQYDDGTTVDLTVYDTLKFSVRSEKATTMRAKLESGGVYREIEVSGITPTWTEKTVALSEYTTGANPLDLSSVNVLFVFVLTGTSDKIDIDEVYFE